MTVTLIGSMGSDLSVVNAARVSYANESKYWYKCSVPECEWSVELQGTQCPTHSAYCFVPTLRDRDKGLINYLVKNRHGTPFEMVQFQFRVRVPIGVAREWFRHRIGSFNEQSTRYVEMQPDFYIPGPEAVRTQTGKAGAYMFEQMSGDDANYCTGQMAVAYRAAYDTYKALLARGVAKELARNVLPLGLMTEFIWSVNLRSMFNFLSLRTAETALLEIRQEAQFVEKLTTFKVPACMEAWNNNGRISL